MTAVERSPDVEAPPILALEHWTLVASDVERTKRFYADALGAEIVQRDWPPSVKLAGITIDIFAAIEGVQKPEPGSDGQHHAYRIRLEDFDRWIERLKAQNVPYQLATHGPRRLSIYVNDPDGYHIELTVPIDDPEVGRREAEKRGIVRFTNPAGPQDR